MEKKRVILYITALVVVLCVIFLPGFSEMQKLREENEQLQKRISLLEQHNENLKTEMHKMEQDPEYLEKKAREKLGIVKKGETIYKTDRDRDNASF